MNIQDEAEEHARGEADTLAANAKILDFGEARARAEGARQEQILDFQSFGGGQFEVRKSGVYFVELDGEERGRETWLCGRLNILALVRNRQREAWGRLLEWNDYEGHAHVWSMPMGLTQGDGLEIRRELTDLGLPIASARKARELLLTYLQVWKSSTFARCVNRLGWENGVFVLPHENLGVGGEERVVFQTNEAVALHALLETRGTAADWREKVAALARNNSRLILATSLAFAAPLLGLLKLQGCGFHLRGQSSLGKSTALRMAASVWGDPQSVVSTWRTTDNGAEGVAMLHNDRLLILDELSEVEPRVAAALSYMLANGVGKQRSSRSGMARDVKTWRLMLLSSGEISLSAKLAEDRRRVSTGQELRLLDVPADAGIGFGLFEDLHGLETPAALAESIGLRSGEYFGFPAREFVVRLAREIDRIRDRVQQLEDQFFEEHGASRFTAQERRAFGKFALVAAGGELASEFGVTGWNLGEAIQGVGKCFHAWREAFTEGSAANSHEAAGALQQVRAFIERHGASRFLDLDGHDPNADHIRDRVGFVQLNGGRRQWLFLTEVFRKDVCVGLDHGQVLKALKEAGWLRHDGVGHLTRKEQLPGLGRTRVYVIEVPEEL
jgi:putative DNA primase/helicase